MGKHLYWIECGDTVNENVRCDRWMQSITRKNKPQVSFVCPQYLASKNTKGRLYIYKYICLSIDIYFYHSIYLSIYLSIDDIIGLSQRYK